MNATPPAPEPEMTTAPELTREPISLDAPEALDPTRCGHKAATLARLKQAGHAVPDGFTLPVHWLDTDDLPVDAIRSALDRLAGPVAVRSSGVAEDLPDVSWAGQYETVLDVRTLEEGLDAVRVCLASRDSARARAYGEAGGMAVLIQRMAPAEAAGVAFSANPVTGRRDQVVINAVRGLGDRLAAGEVSGDEWTVTDHAEPVVNSGVLSPPDVDLVAALARTLEAELGHPVDIEWALVAGALVLLQARPITALPVPPAITAPPADQVWMKDAAHFSGPITPFGASVYLPQHEGVVHDFAASWGLMVERLDYGVFGHEAYTHATPFGGVSETAAAPPWWLLGILSRVVPSIRKRLAICQQALDSGRRQAIVDAWFSHKRSDLLAELAALRAVELDRLTDSQLHLHIDELLAFARRNQKLHFELFGPYLFGLYDLARTCQDLLGWDIARSLRLLDGLSVASAAPTVALHELAAYLSTRPAARACIQDDPAWLTTLQALDPEAARAVDSYRDDWGLRTLDYDPGSPSLAERPTLFANLVRDAVLAPAKLDDLEQERQAAIADARAGLGGTDSARFDAVLAEAERVYPLREDNVMLTDNLPSGLLHRGGMELGRRLVAAGRLLQAEDAMLLSLEELREAVAGGGDPRALAARRKAELAWVRANPGPSTYGPAPGRPPDVKGLPPAARLFNGAMIWFMDMELVPPSASGADLTGIGACAGIYRGRVRVITHVEDLHRLQRGEILVCPITTPAWSVMFSQAGALITDSGSILSHAAIIAREHGVPAVVATGNATSALRDGMEVTVDGATGSVRIHDPHEARPA